MRIRGLGLVAVSVFLLGCSVEVADEGDAEVLGQQSAALRSAPWPYDDLYMTPWAAPDWAQPLPYLPSASVGTVNNGASVFFSNDHDFSLEVGGAIFYTCTKGQSQDAPSY